MLPEAGSVLGIDVGWSLSRRSSGICRLDWDASKVSWTVDHFNGRPDVRERTVRKFVEGHVVHAATFDGPLCPDFRIANRFRMAERLLTAKGIADRISQPASSAGSNGRRFNEQTHLLAQLVLAHAILLPARHRHPVHDLAIGEAFPSSFLGLMIAEPARGVRAKRSDRYFVNLTEAGTLERLVRHHLPGRDLLQQFADVTNHDDRAALVCALTALGVAGDDYVCVGDSEDGWIILPPPSFVAPWATSLIVTDNGRLVGSPF